MRQFIAILRVFLHADDPSDPIMETSHHPSLHVGRMMGLKVEIPVCMCGLPVVHYYLTTKPEVEGFLDQGYVIPEVESLRVQSL